MNVKSKYTFMQQRDENRKPWTKDCVSFKKLVDICTVTATCKCPSQHGWKKKLTKFTVDAFISTTKCNIAAANHLLEVHNFQYVLPGTVNSQSALEKFFVQGRQRKGRNFYIDITDIVAATKVSFQKVKEQ